MTISTLTNRATASDAIPPNTATTTNQKMSWNHVTSGNTTGNTNPKAVTLPVPIQTTPGSRVAVSRGRTRTAMTMKKASVVIAKKVREMVTKKVQKIIVIMILVRMNENTGTDAVGEMRMIMRMIEGISGEVVNMERTEKARNIEGAMRLLMNQRVIHTIWVA